MRGPALVHALAVTNDDVQRQNDVRLMQGGSSPVQWIEKNPKTLFVMGAHHKTGTFFCHGVGLGLEVVASGQYWIVRKETTVRGMTQATLLRPLFVLEGQIDTKKYMWMKTARVPLRFVHLVREPVALVVSGYIYHRTHPRDNGGTPMLPQRLAIVNTSDGLDLEARAALRRTLPQMASVVNATRGDPNVLLLGLEDVAHNFTAAVAAILEHFFSGLATYDATRLVDLIAVTAAPPPPPKASKSHVAPVNETRRLHQLVAGVNSKRDPALWNRVTAYRDVFGYVYSGDDEDATTAGWHLRTSPLYNDSHSARRR